MKHSIVDYKKGIFSAWPSNGGAWSWGNEILVAYNTGIYQKTDGHCVDKDTLKYGFSRSLDGGETWCVEKFDNDFGYTLKSIPAGGFDFSNKDFIIRIGTPEITINGSTFLASDDRGHTWHGPYPIDNFNDELTARTCYHIENAKTMRLFMSLKHKDIVCDEYTDRAFVAITYDGGQTYEKLGSMTNDPHRSVMPSAVRLSDNSLVCAIRRRNDNATNYGMPYDQDNWIEVVRSIDDGRTWTFASRAAETSHEVGKNGNPPAMVALGDDSLVLAFGYRGEKPAIKVKLSKDGGYTWTDDRIIRDDAAGSDIGYPRMIVRPDGKLVVMYYYTTEERIEQHIASTIFEV